MQKNCLFIVLACLNCAHTTHAVESNPSSEANATTMDTRLKNLTPDQQAKVDKMAQVIKHMYAPPLWKTKMPAVSDKMENLMNQIDNAENGMVLGYSLTPEEKATLRSLQSFDESQVWNKEQVAHILETYPKHISILYAVAHSLKAALWKPFLNFGPGPETNPTKLDKDLRQLIDNLNKESDSTQRDKLIDELENSIDVARQKINEMTNQVTEAENMYIPIVKQMYDSMGPMLHAYMAVPRDQKDNPASTKDGKKIAQIPQGPFEYMVQTYLPIQRD